MNAGYYALAARVDRLRADLDAAWTAPVFQAEKIAVINKELRELMAIDRPYKADWGFAERGRDRGKRKRRKRWGTGKKLGRE